MENSFIEDIRKKRDNREVVEGHASKTDEKSKKIRARRLQINDNDVFLDAARGQIKSKNISNGSESHEDSTGNISNEASLLGSKVCNIADKVSVVADKEGGGHQKALDLESALHHVVHLSEGVKEFIADDLWISFRVGHAGDASALAACVRKSAGDEKQDNNALTGHDKKVPSTGNGATTSEDTSLEVRLADGLGDEDTPPSIFALIVDINKKGDEPKLVAASMFSSAWDESSRILLVEWFFVDYEKIDLADIIERRLWLRLCTISLMTACDKIVGKKSLTGV